MIEPCTVILGNRGSGKSETLKVELLRIGMEHESAVFAFDLPGTLSEEMVGHLWAAGVTTRTFYEEVRLVDKVLSIPFVEGSEDEQENELAIEQFTQALWAKIGGKENIGWRKQYLDAAAGVFITLPEEPNIDFICRLFEPESREHEWMLATAEGISPVCSATWNSGECGTRTSTPLKHPRRSEWSNRSASRLSGHGMDGPSRFGRPSKKNGRCTST